MTSANHDISRTGPHTRVHPSPNPLPRRADRGRHRPGIERRATALDLARLHADLDNPTPAVERVLLGGMP